jgi:hypothetical protein
MANNCVKITVYEGTKIARDDVHPFDDRDLEDCDRAAKIVMSRDAGDDASCFRAFRGLPIVGQGGGF